MVKIFKKFLAILAVITLSLTTLFSCTKDATISKNAPENDKGIVILFTNDVHCAVDDNIGYAGVAEYRNRLAADNYVILADAGDFSQGAPIGTLSKGLYLVDIMKEMGYDFCVPGNHEFDYNMANFLQNCLELNNLIYSCNFIDLRNNKTVLPPYKMFTLGNKKVALVGATTPESFTKSTPAYFQDNQGKYIYTLSEDNNGKKLYRAIQKSVNDARKEGADYVILVGHLGIDGTTDRWKSNTVIANTTGIDAVIDGHSHEVYNQMVKNKKGREIPLVQTGTKLKNIGQLTIGKDGNISIQMVDHVVPIDGSPVETERGQKIHAKDSKINAYIKNIQAKYQDSIKEVIIPTNKINLITTFPFSKDRAVRKAETNLGDLCADAYRTVLGADIGFMNGGGIRNEIPLGNVTYEDCLKVMPFNNLATLIRCKGQVVKDALEMGAHLFPEENGGFIHVSGLTYTIDGTIPSSVKLDDKNNFISVDGEYRVRDIKVGGADLDLNKDYTVACHDYMLINGGDGFTMFKGSEVLKDRVMPDVDALVEYLKAEGTSKYNNLAGEGRITIIQ